MISLCNFQRTFPLAAVVCLLFPLSTSRAHDGPDPIAHWNFNARSLQSGKLKARLGPDGKIEGSFQRIQDQYGESVMLPGQGSILIADDLKTVNKYLPKRHLTASAWVSINTRQRWGGIMGVIQDNGSAESGWLLGYNQQRFTFALASQGSNDGDGKLTYLEGKTRYELGRLYHVVAVYDGQSMELYVNGKLEATSRQQSGDILYPSRAPVVLGGYRDRDEDYPHHGRLREVAIYDRAAKAKWVTHQFEHHQELTRLAPHAAESPEMALAIRPYLQYVTQSGITVMWQTSRTGSSRVHFGETAEVIRSVDGPGQAILHEVKLTGLKPETQYFYRVESTDADGGSVKSEVRTFQTANRPRTPFAFAIISDTQSNPRVAEKIANLAWSQRPNFLLHPGDLVGTGTNDGHWTRQFFPSMHPLISRVAFFPVLGNHEQNARNYYDYMSLPDPEYYYEFRYGNAHFFMLDTNKKVGPGSEQYQWLEKKLSQSDATWKFVCHHHPPYSSDENDYGNLWKTNKSTRGDLRVRELSSLYDKHGVDIVFCGHIHSYERTWPLKNNLVVEKDGPIYMITGGGGGSLETPGPTRPWFQNNVKRGHHYCMVAINGKTLEFKAFDLEGRLFDTMKLVK